MGRWVQRIALMTWCHHAIVIWGNNNREATNRLTPEIVGYLGKHNGNSFNSQNLQGILKGRRLSVATMWWKKWPFSFYFAKFYQFRIFTILTDIIPMFSSIPYGNGSDRLLSHCGRFCWIAESPEWTLLSSWHLRIRGHCFLEYPRSLLSVSLSVSSMANIPTRRTDGRPGYYQVTSRVWWIHFLWQRIQCMPRRHGIIIPHYQRELMLSLWFSGNHFIMPVATFNDPGLLPCPRG